MAKTTVASALGARLSQARSQARVELGRLAGRDLSKIGNNEQLTLLVAIGQMIGLIGADFKLTAMGKTVWLAEKSDGIIAMPCEGCVVEAEASKFAVVSSDDSALATIESEMVLYSPTMPGVEKPSVEELRRRRDYCKRLGIPTQKFIILFGAENARKNRMAAANNLINWCKSQEE